MTSTAEEENVRKYLRPPQKFRLKLSSTNAVGFTHFKRTVNRYCGMAPTLIFGLAILSAHEI